MKSANPERKAIFADLARKIGAMSEDQRATLAQSIPVVTVAGHALSVRNACMVAMQCPTATIVGGFKQWLAAGRCVMKGEHGHLIIVPASKKNAETGEVGETFFIPGTVFDVSQTCELGAKQESDPAPQEVKITPAYMIPPVAIPGSYYSNEFTPL